MSVPVQAAYGFAGLAVMMPMALLCERVRTKRACMGVLLIGIITGIAGPMMLSRISFNSELVVVVSASTIVLGLWLDRRIPVRHDAYRAIVRARSLEKLRRMSPRAAEAIENFRRSF